MIQRNFVVQVIANAPKLSRRDLTDKSVRRRSNQGTSQRGYVFYWVMVPGHQSPINKHRSDCLECRNQASLAHNLYPARIFVPITGQW